jgi:hypothetical protein
MSGYITLNIHFSTLFSAFFSLFHVFSIHADAVWLHSHLIISNTGEIFFVVSFALVCYFTETHEIEWKNVSRSLTMIFHNADFDDHFKVLDDFSEWRGKPSKYCTKQYSKNETINLNYSNCLNFFISYTTDFWQKILKLQLLYCLCHVEWEHGNTTEWTCRWGQGLHNCIHTKN